MKAESTGSAVPARCALLTQGNQIVSGVGDNDLGAPCCPAEKHLLRVVAALMALWVARSNGPLAALLLPPSLRQPAGPFTNISEKVGKLRHTNRGSSRSAHSSSGRLCRGPKDSGMPGSHLPPQFLLRTVKIQTGYLWTAVYIRREQRRGWRYWKYTVSWLLGQICESHLSDFKLFKFSSSTDVVKICFLLTVTLNSEVNKKMENRCTTAHLLHLLKTPREKAPESEGEQKLQR